MNSPDDMKIKIAGNLTKADWKARKKILEQDGSEENWKKAYEDFFKKRIETRYFAPISLLLTDGKDAGEGFAIVALQCSLVEFLASTLEGKSYRHCQQGKCKCEENEYHDSISMFRRFLRCQTPFKKYFNSNRQADLFYKNVRCALLHEARTKGGWKIRAGGDSNPPIDVKEKIVYRGSLQGAFEAFIRQYGEKLPGCKNLQGAFIRKFESLCKE